MTTMPTNLPPQRPAPEDAFFKGVANAIMFTAVLVGIGYLLGKLFL